MAEQRRAERPGEERDRERRERASVAEAGSEAGKNSRGNTSTAAVA